MTKSLQLASQTDGLIDVLQADIPAALRAKMDKIAHLPAGIPLPTDYMPYLDADTNEYKKTRLSNITTDGQAPQILPAPGQEAGSYFALSRPTTVELRGAEDTTALHTIAFDMTVRGNGRITKQDSTHTINLQSFSDAFDALQSGTSYILAAQFVLDEPPTNDGSVTFSLQSEGAVLLDIDARPFRKTLELKSGVMPDPVLLVGLVKVQDAGQAITAAVQTDLQEGLRLADHAKQGGCCFLAQALLPHNSTSLARVQFEADTGVRLTATSYQIGVLRNLVSELEQAQPGTSYITDNTLKLADGFTVHTAGTTTLNVTLKSIRLQNGSPGAGFVLTQEESQILSGHTVIAKATVQSEQPVQIFLAGWTQEAAPSSPPVIVTSTGTFIQQGWVELSRDYLPANTATSMQLSATTTRFVKNIAIWVVPQSLDTPPDFTVKDLSLSAASGFVGCTLNTHVPWGKDFTASYFGGEGANPIALLTAEQELTIPMKLNTVTPSSWCHLENEATGTLVFGDDFSGIAHVSANLWRESDEPGDVDVTLYAKSNNRLLPMSARKRTSAVRDKRENRTVSYAIPLKLPKGSTVSWALTVDSGAAQVGVKSYTADGDLPALPAFSVTFVRETLAPFSMPALPTVTNRMKLEVGALGYASFRYTINNQNDPMPIGQVSSATGKGITIDRSVNLVSGSEDHSEEGAILFHQTGTATFSGSVWVTPGESLNSPGRVDFWFAKRESDGRWTELPNSKTTIGLQPGLPASLHELTPFASAVEAGTKIGLFARSSGTDHAYIETTGTPMVTINVELDL